METLDRHGLRARRPAQLRRRPALPAGHRGRPRAQLLAELGLRYLLDWTNDDQPYALNVPGMLSVPYSVELNDLSMFMSRGLTGPEARQMITDQFDQLYADSADTGRVMALALHPFVSGQPFRHRYIDEALAYISGHDGVWLTTSDEIAEHYARQSISSNRRSSFSPRAGLSAATQAMRPRR
jgi:peptidoglycan/xylan/chitin deacetylase (PgdA/CDA1 family)